MFKQILRENNINAIQNFQILFNREMPQRQQNPRVSPNILRASLRYKKKGNFIMINLKRVVKAIGLKENFIAQQLMIFNDIHYVVENEYKKKCIFL